MALVKVFLETCIFVIYIRVHKVWSMPPRSGIIITARIDTVPSLDPKVRWSWVMVGSHTWSHPEERVAFPEHRGVGGGFLTLLFAFGTV